MDTMIEIPALRRMAELAPNSADTDARTVEVIWSAGARVRRSTLFGEPYDEVRVVSRQVDAITNFGDARLWSETTRIDLRVAEVPASRPGDRLEMDGDAFLIQGEPIRDRERLVWTVDLRPA